MADFAGTPAFVAYRDAFGGHPGEGVFTITLSAAAYAGGNLNLASIAPKFKGSNAQPQNFKFFDLRAHGSSGNCYLVLFAPAASPTWDNLGTLKLFTATNTEASGSLTLTVYGRFSVMPVGLNG